MRIYLGVLFLFVVTNAFSIAPQFWEENSQQNFIDGDPQSVSITSDGEMLLAPRLKKVYEGTDSIIWKIVKDSKGNLYAATGNEGKIIKIDPSGKASTFLDTAELEVQSLIVDKQDNLFAATSPDGKIYKIQPDGASRIFFDPDDKYIWTLLLDDSGNLYAGTGDQGKIYKIDKEGNGKVLADTNEVNITALAWDPQKNLLAGSDRNGILYRIDPSSGGKAFVLFDSNMQQITSIHSSPDGDIFFAAITGLVAAPEVKAAPEITTSDQSVSVSTEGEEVTTTVEVAAPQPPQAVAPTAAAGASQLYRISPEGAEELIYTSPEDQILDIGGYKDGTILLSTGKKAKLIVVDKNKKSTLLIKSTEEQITSMLRGSQLWFATANPAGIYQLSQEYSSTGTYFSHVKDTQALSSWGQVSWKAVVPSGTGVALSVRSGNTRTPDETWSAWSSAGTNSAGQQTAIPRARFVQWKADFSTTDPKVTPLLRSVQIAYLQQNIRPEVASITMQPPGAVFRKAYSQETFAGVPESISDDKDEQQTAVAQSGTDQTVLGKQDYRKGYQTITWNASDQNQDNLTFDVDYRPAGEKNWKELARNLKEKVFAWDTQTIPDGTYVVRVTASDLPSNPAEVALSNSRESEPFDVDNSAPRLEVLKSYKEAGAIILEVRAQDQFSAIKELLYSIKPGIWSPVFPIDSINDSPTETYRIEIKNPPADATEIILKCSDRLNNTAVIKSSLPR